MADSEYTDDETEYEGPSSQAVIWVCFRHVNLFIDVPNRRQDAFWTPFRMLFSKTAFRIYLNTLLFIGATLLLLGISGIAYGIFYLRFIPTVGVDREVHLQFG